MPARSIPAILPTISTLLVLNIGSLCGSAAFEKVFLLYTPTTYETADIIATYVYRMGLGSGNYSYATAVGLFQGVINLVLLTVANKVSSWLTPGYYCKGLSIGQTSDDQIDLREELGYACGNFMYSGNTELLTSNFTDDLRDFYDRQGQYRKLRPLDPTVTFDEDQMEMLNLWGTPMTDTVNAWTCKFAMNQADINNDWDTYVAEVEAQNMQNIVDMYNDTYNASK